jgi:hypothetical protein
MSLLCLSLSLSLSLSLYLSCSIHLPSHSHRPSGIQRGVNSRVFRYLFLSVSIYVALHACSGYRRYVQHSGGCKGESDQVRACFLFSRPAFLSPPLDLFRFKLHPDVEEDDERRGASRKSANKSKKGGARVGGDEKHSFSMWSYMQQFCRRVINSSFFGPLATGATIFSSIFLCLEGKGQRPGM